MQIDNNVPFFSNTPDDTHCLQAALKMILQYFEPSKDYSWNELEVMTKKKKGLWTWPLATMMWMRNNGYEVIDIEMFDYKKFIADPKGYLVTFYGQEVAKEQIEHSDIEQETDLARSLIYANIVHLGIPTFETIEELLDKGYLLISLVNSQYLNNKQGYVGHFVVIKGYEHGQLILHDPGLPPHENRRVSRELFEKAWAVPDEHAKNIMAFKLIDGS